MAKLIEFLFNNNKKLLFRCEHCKRLAPSWNDLAKKFSDNGDAEVVIAQVDCTVETALCSDNDVTGYPT